MTEEKEEGGGAKMAGKVGMQSRLFEKEFMYKTGCKAPCAYSIRQQSEANPSTKVGNLHNLRSTRAYRSLEPEPFSDLRTGTPSDSPFLAFLCPHCLPRFCVALLVGEVEFLCPIEKIH